MASEPPILQKAPPLDPAWLAYEREANLLAPKPAMDPIQRQPLYADECRRRNAAMMAEGARDHHLSRVTKTKYLYVSSSRDGSAIPVLRYDRVGSPDAAGEPDWVVVYYHGGGLLVGEADSEDLSCRRIVGEAGGSSFSLALYSVGYRLKPQHRADVCVSDSVDAFNHVLSTHPGSKIIIAGSSSGGELAALVTQQVPKEYFHGVLLRCPVTSDAFRGRELVPERLRNMHTSAWDLSFQTSIFSRLDMDGPRDGLDKMPLEADIQDLKGMPRTWVQVCTNDGLYSDGACYSRILRDAGVEVKTDVVWGWPHTFWLKAPHLSRALAADVAMIGGIRWIAGLDR